MEQKELTRILDNHKLWLESNGEKGMRADLRDIDLTVVNLEYAVLEDANLTGADLRWASLKGVNLECASLRSADLIGAELIGANLKAADLIGANLRGADLSNAVLKGANLTRARLVDACLRYANLVGANLSNASLRCADLSGANVENAILPPSLDNLPEGELIGYKKVKDCIVKLQILADSKRSRATSNKCRCDKALVLAIENEDGTDSGLTQIVNYRFTPTTYEVGEIVYADSWDEDRWNECSHGIHFFLDRKMAVDW